MAQTFWSKYKVLILGMLSAAIAAISPLVFNNENEPYNYKAIVIAAIIAAATLYGQEARGKNWTIGGQAAAAVIAIVLAYSNNYDMFKVIIAGIAAWGSLPIPPMKLSTYEHSEPIVEAKIQAAQMKADAKGQSDTEPK